jgi:hypothetical protein
MSISGRKQCLRNKRLNRGPLAQRWQQKRKFGGRPLAREFAIDVRGNDRKPIKGNDFD